MTSKERVKKAISHKVSDRIPQDYWAVFETTEKLMKFFGVDTEEDVLQKLNIDCRYVKPNYNGKIFNEEKDGSLQQKMGNGTYKDVWGVRRVCLNLQCT